jgi:hypothetical protein
VLGQEIGEDLDAPTHHPAAWAQEGRRQQNAALDLGHVEARATNLDASLLRLVQCSPTRNTAGSVYTARGIAE